MIRINVKLGQGEHLITFESKQFRYKTFHKFKGIIFCIKTIKGSSCVNIKGLMIPSLILIKN